LERRYPFDLYRPRNATSGSRTWCTCLNVRRVSWRTFADDCTRPHTEPRFELQSAHPAVPCCPSIRPSVRPTPLVNHPPFSCNFMLNFRHRAPVAARFAFPSCALHELFFSLFFIYFLFFSFCRTSGAVLHIVLPPVCCFFLFSALCAHLSTCGFVFNPPPSSRAPAPDSPGR